MFGKTDYTKSTYELISNNSTQECELIHSDRAETVVWCKNESAYLNLHKEMLQSGFTLAELHYRTINNTKQFIVTFKRRKTSKVKKIPTRMVFRRKGFINSLKVIVIIILTIVMVYVNQQKRLDSYVRGLETHKQITTYLTEYEQVIGNKYRIKEFNHNRFYPTITIATYDDNSRSFHKDKDKYIIYLHPRKHKIVRIEYCGEYSKEKECQLININKGGK